MEIYYYVLNSNVYKFVKKIFINFFNLPEWMGDFLTETEKG